MAIALTPINRLREKNELLVKLGALLGPLEASLAQPSQFSQDEKVRIAARYCDDWPRFEQAFITFTTAEPGHKYRVQQAHMHGALSGILSHLISEPDRLAETFPALKQRATDAIAAIPVTVDSVICPSATPFSTYCTVKEICRAASTQLVIVDAYLDASVFYRYLEDVGPSVVVTLVAKQPGPSAGPRDRNRYGGLLDVSRLYAAERGPSHYRLLAHPALHDRFIRTDDVLRQIGGSLKDAGQKEFAISKLDSVAENFKRLDDIIAAAMELFGRSAATHP